MIADQIKDNVERSNDRLFQVVQNLKRLSDRLGGGDADELGDDYSKPHQLAGRANDVLYEAIENCFPYANAVVVTATVDPKRVLREASEDNSRHYMRRFLTTLEGESFDADQPYNMRLVLPLPYSFTTGTHGSGERAAQGASYQTIFLRMCRENDPLVEVLVNVGSTKGIEDKEEGRREFVARCDLSIAIDEIESLELARVRDREFTPVYDDNMDRTYVPETSNDHHMQFVENSQRVF